MAETRVSEVILKAKSDVTGFTQLRIESAKVRGEMRYLADEAKRVDLASAQAGKSVRTAFTSQSSNSIRSLVGPTEDATKQMNRLKESITGVQGEIKTLRSLKTDALDLVPNIDDITGSGKGRGFRETLKFIGREGRALPSQQIPGLGIGTDGISKLISLTGSLPAPVLAAGAAIAVLGTGVVALNTILADNKGKMDAATKANTTYYDLIRNKTTSSELQKQINDLSTAQAADLAELQSITQAFESGFSETANIIGNDGAKILFALGQVSDADDLLTARADELRKSTSENFASINTLMRAQGSAAVVANDLAAATEAAAKAEAELAALRAQNAVKGDQSRINAQIEAANLAATGTEKQVQDRIDALAREKQVILANLPILREQARQAEAGSEAQKILQAQVDGYIGRLAELDTSIMTLAGDTLVAAKANDAAAESEKKRADSISATIKYNEDVARITQQNAEKQADLAQKLADKQIEIAAKTLDDSEKLLEKLQEKYADLVTDAQRDLDKDVRKANFEGLQEQIKFQKNEVTETRKHLQDLERIRRQSREAEFEQGLDRDFAGLARTRRATANQLAESNIQFNEERQARLDAFAEKIEDDRNQFIFERQERIIKFQQDIADLQLQGARERKQINDNAAKALQQARANYDRDLSLLRSKFVSELNARNLAIQAELKMINQGNTAKLAEEAKYYAQSLQLIKGVFGSVGGSTKAGAGSAGKFKSSSGGSGLSVSGSAPFSTAGAFTPLTNQAVGGGGAGGRSLTVHMPIYSSKADPEAIGVVVEKHLTKFAHDILGDEA